MEEPSVQKSPKNQIDLAPLIVKAIGYLFVAYLCLVTGKMFRLGIENFGDLLQKSIPSDPEQFFFLFFVFAYHLQRVVIFDRKETYKDMDNSVIRLSKHLPYTATISPFFVAIFFTWNNFLPNSIFPISIAFLTYAYFFYIEGKSWKGFLENVDNKEYERKHFSFRNIIFFPALLTCIVPFVYGYAYSANPSVVLLFSFIILLYHIRSKNIYKIKKSGYFYKLDFSFMIFSLLVVVVTLIMGFPDIPIDIVKNANTPIAIGLLFTVGIYMTMLMGVSESWYFLKDDKNYKDTHDIRDEDKNALLVGTYLFPITLPVLIFTPTANWLFLSLIAFSYMQYLFWNFYEDYNKSSFFWWLSKMIFGSLVPILLLVALNPYIQFHPYRFNEKIDWSYIGFALGLVITLFIVISSTSIYKDFTAEFEKKWKNGFWASGVVFGLACIGGFFAYALNWPVLLVAKFKIVAASCLLLNLFILIIMPTLSNTHIKYRLIREEKRKKKNGHSDDNNIINIVGNVLKTSRLISISSGLLTMFTICIKIGWQHLDFAIIRAIPIIIVTMIAFILNDIYDKEKDKIAGKNRPISTGKLSVKNAYFAVGILSVSSLLVDILFQDYNSLLVIIFTLISVALYSPFAKNFPLFKGLCTSVISCTPLYYSAQIIHYDINILYFIPIVIFIVGREILLDVYDAVGDKKYKMLTIPNLIGIKLSRKISWILMIIGCLCMVLFSRNIGGGILSGIITGIILYLSFLKKGERFEVRWTRLAIFAGSVAISLMI